ncbi:MAG: hypothetical protein IJ346_04010 [Clostridia bacterium]|nr:hypothetical protein [Clostridia bacterium]
MKNKTMKRVLSVALAVLTICSVLSVSALSANAASNRTELGVGDQVLIPKYSGTEIKIDGTIYGVLK